MSNIEIIKEKLKELKNLDKGFSIFGSERHKYVCNQALSSKEIGQIEKNNNIELTPEYKEILMRLGNGGAGCGYGLEKLSLKNISPPFMGSKELLNKYKDHSEVDFDMVDTDKISGYIKLFDYGCGMEYCLVVNGYEKGAIIYFDTDERFEKLNNNGILLFYNHWLDNSLNTLKRVEKKLLSMPLTEVIDTELLLNNYSVKENILSIINASPIIGGHSGNEIDAHLVREYKKWAATY